MGKLSVLIWIMAAPTLMGILVTVTLVVPYFMNDQDLWIPVAAVAGAVIAAPISYWISKSIKKLTAS